MSNAFIDYKVYCYVLAFLRNHTGSIYDEDFFLPLTTRITVQAIERSIGGNFTKAELTKLETVKRSRSRLNWDEEPNAILTSIWNAPGMRRRMLAAIEEMCQSKLEVLKASQFKRDKFKQRLDELQSTLGLSDCECDLLLLSFSLQNRFMGSSDRFARQSSIANKIDFLAKCLDKHTMELKQAMEASQKLRRYGCVGEDLEFNSDLDGFLSGVGTDPLSSQYYQRNKEKTLPWSFYGTLAEKHGEMLKTLISARDPKRGLNILLYGAPGTGKTSFAHSLADELSLTCYDIVQST